MATNDLEVGCKDLLLGTPCCSLVIVGRVKLTINLLCRMLEDCLGAASSAVHSVLESRTIGGKVSLERSRTQIIGVVRINPRTGRAYLFATVLGRASHLLPCIPGLTTASSNVTSPAAFRSTIEVFQCDSG